MGMKLNVAFKQLKLDILMLQYNEIILLVRNICCFTDWV